mgnify:FL=1
MEAIEWERFSGNALGAPLLRAGTPWERRTLFRRSQALPGRRFRARRRVWYNGLSSRFFRRFGGVLKKAFGFVIAFGLCVWALSAGGLSSLFPAKVQKTPTYIGDLLIVDIPPFSRVLSFEGLTDVKELKDKVIAQLALPKWSVVLFRNGLLGHRDVFGGQVAMTDSDHDGFPDEAELWGDDATRFRHWFVYIAMQQKVEPSPAWKDRDCAGLIRFALQEALRKHDAKWYERVRIPPAAFPDIEAFHYPAVPTLGAQIYQLKEGFYSFANARNLYLYNVDKVSHSLGSEVKPGDLLFLYHPQDTAFPYHVMIYTGDGFVYHTGSSDVSEGEVRLWKTEEYMKAAPLTWLPVKENPNFLGFFRLKILNDDLS